jgi:hypothetical protein
MTPAKRRSSPDRRPTDRQQPLRRRRPCTRKLASGGQSRRQDLRQGVSRCKSLNAPRMRPPVRREGVRPLFHRWYSPTTGRYTRPEPEWYGDYFNTNPYFYALANPVRHWDPDGRRYWPPPVGGSVENYSPCPVLVFGDPGPLTKSEPIIVPAGGRRFFGLLPDPARSPYFGDVDFVCVGGQWIKIRGPAWIREDGQLRTTFPARSATPGDEQGLPPCKDPSCQCTPPGGPNGR